MKKNFLIGFCIIIIILLLVSCSQSKPPAVPEVPKPTIESTNDTPNSISAPEPLSKPKPKQDALAIVPNRINIPSIGVDAPVIPVGILDNGQMEVPESSEIVGVLAPGVIPGEPGSAIMAGHVDSHTGPAIFYPLKKLNPGDPIIISNEDGQSIVFQVTSIESYLTAEAPLDEIFGDTEQARLNLITCTGKFNRKIGTHEKRLVVFTRLME